MKSRRSSPVHGRPLHHPFANGMNEMSSFIVYIYGPEYTIAASVERNILTKDDHGLRNFSVQWLSLPALLSQLSPASRFSQESRLRHCPSPILMRYVAITFWKFFPPWSRFGVSFLLCSLRSITDVVTSQKILKLVFSAAIARSGVLRRCRIGIILAASGQQSRTCQKTGG